MIYFDNAATTMPKPPEVVEAVAHALRSFGGAGRGAHEAALDAGATVFRARQKIADLLGAPGPRQVAFTANATEALNMAVCGLLQPGDHVVTTAASHNSVLRPLYRLQDEGRCDLSVVPVARDGSLDYGEFEHAFRPETRLAVVTHASNLTGTLYDVERLAAVAHANGALIVVDAAQTAGLMDIDMKALGLDVVCFTGHKSLFGPQGTGGLCVAEAVDIAPLAVGGSGTRSFDRAHPSDMPERLEAGTLNAHGIAGLLAGVAYLESKGVSTIRAETLALARRFEQGARAIDSVTIYAQGQAERTGIVALNIGNVDSALVADLLAREQGIATRAGIHCAPLMHEALGTAAQGAVRFSFSHFNTEAEVDAGIEALAALAEELC